jgi:hypothetical protein
VGRVAERVGAAPRAPATELDARRAPAAHDDLPGTAQAFDPGVMAECFERALLVGGGAVTACTAGQATYLPGRFALVRYTIEARDRAGDPWSALLNVRVWPGRAESDRYLTGRLRPLVERARGREELRAFEAPAVSLDELAVTVAAWPIDGDLPTLGKAVS